MFYNIENINKKVAINLCITKFLRIFVQRKRTKYINYKNYDHENKRIKNDAAFAFDQFKEI